MKVVLLTGSELRHQFFRKYISNQKEIQVQLTTCESLKGNLSETVDLDNNNNLRKLHLSSRNQYEKDFFELYCDSIEDKSNPQFIDRGDVNNVEIVSTIINLKPDLIISYGCSIIRSELIDIFNGRFINIHLGLSPYYMGSGTNYWPFVNDELQFVGTTFMYIDRGIDTGEIIHQIRAKIFHGDNIHQVGNRLIRDSVIECVKLIQGFEKLDKFKRLDVEHNKIKIYKKKDFTESSLISANKNITEGMISKYLKNKSSVDRLYPIIENNIK